VGQILGTVILVAQQGHAAEHPVIIAHDFVELLVGALVPGIQDLPGKAHEANHHTTPDEE
jgi:hypothetical protein